MKNLTCTFAAPIAIPLANGLSLLLACLMLFSMGAGLVKKPGWFVHALMLTLIIIICRFARDHQPRHYHSFYLPLFCGSARISELDNRGNTVVFLVQTGLNLLLWFGFLKFIIGTNFEHPFMHGFLPLLLLVLYLADWRGLFSIARKIEAGG